MSLLPVSAIPVEGGYNINNSLRLRASAGGRLSRTFGTPTNTSTWTFSAWIKRGDLAPTTAATILASRPVATTTAIYFNTAGNLVFWNNEAVVATSTAIFRDPAAWYHVVVSSNGTTTTAYVNNETVLTGTGDLALINNSGTHYIGHAATTGNRDFDGYFAETYFVDGQALTPSSFGETNTTTGVWQPKAYTGTYGINGFYLKFSDIAQTVSSNVGLGQDFSGNANFWVTTNISTTSGTTYDAMTDSPTNTSATVSNYCVVNPLTIVSGNTISNGNLTISGNGTTYNNTSTIAVTSGKWYYEVSVPSAGNYYIGIGTSDGQAANFSSQYVTYRSGTGYKNITGTQTVYGATYTTGDTIGVAFDLDAGTIEFYKNNSNQGSISLPSSTINSWYPVMYVNGTIHLNFGQQPFTYTPPTGFVRLNTYNLPDSTIKKGNSYMDATLYTGTAASRSITNAASFRPDFVWIKGRSIVVDNDLFDSVRGVNLFLISNSNAAEGNNPNTLTAFNSNGFNLGTSAFTNSSGATFVAWQWQAGSSTVTNTSGTISAQVRANTTTGFSILTYTGTGANATVGHGLGVAPKMVIVKKNIIASGGTATAWIVWHTGISNTQYLMLNVTDAVATNTTVWNSISPTSTVISVGTNIQTNRSTDGYVAYCWAEIAGFSKFGSYTGNGSADGPFVYLGFRPKFIIYKRTNSTGSWGIFDTSRNTYNLSTNVLYANLADAEYTSTGAGFDNIDILSNGFKPRQTNSGINASGSTYIYAAFAENPFKNALAR